MAAAKKRQVHVTVGGQTFAPEDKIPADLEKLIDNPKVFGQPDEQPPAAVDPAGDEG